MVWLNNSFIRALVLLAIVLLFFWVAMHCGVADVRAEIMGLATAIGAIAVGRLQHGSEEPSKDQKQDPPPPAQPTVPSNGSAA